MSRGVLPAMHSRDTLTALALFVAILHMAQPNGIMLWPNCSFLYTFAPDSRYSIDVYRLFMKVRHFIEEHTYIRFVRWRPDYPWTYVNFSTRNQNTIRYGFQPDVFQFNLCSRGCNEWNILKNILHLLGFAPEQKRHDRSDYLDVHYINEKRRCHDNLLLTVIEDYPPVELPFAFESVLYEDGLCCETGKICMEPRFPDAISSTHRKYNSTPTQSIYEVEIQRLQAFYPNYYCSNFGLPI